MVYTTLASLVIYVKVLQVIIEVDAAGAKVSAKQGGVSGEDSGDINVPLSAERDGEACLPLMEVRDDCCMCLSGDVLGEC